MQYNKNGIQILDNKTKKVPIDICKKEKILKKTNGKCFYCSIKLQLTDKSKSNYMTIDHVRPRSKMGSNKLWNLLPSCEKCNIKKGSLYFKNFVKQVQEMKINRCKYERELSIGEVIKINGVPVKYLGNNKIGSNTKFDTDIKDKEETTDKLIKNIRYV